MLVKVLYEVYTESTGFITMEKVFSSLKEFGYWCMYKSKINSSFTLIEVQYYE